MPYDTRAFNLRNEEKGWTKEKRRRMSLDFDPTSILIHSKTFHSYSLHGDWNDCNRENRRQKECGDREGCLEKFSGLSLPPSLGITLYSLRQETWEMKGEVLVSLVFYMKRNACRASPALGMRVSIRAWFKCVFILNSSFFILEILVKLLSVFPLLEPLLRTCRLLASWRKLCYGCRCHMLPVKREEILRGSLRIELLKMKYKQMDSTEKVWAE